MEKIKIVVIGNGMVGYKFCEKLLACKNKDQFEVVVFGEEIRPAYDRVHLSEFFSGKSAEDLSMGGVDWYSNNGIKLHLSDPILNVDRVNKIAYSSKGKVESYHYIVLATGSTAFVPTIPGVNKVGVFVYRTIEDLEKIRAYAPRAKKGAVIGGGLLGLEAAKAMLDLGISDTHVIEFSSRLMPRQIDENGSKLLQNKLESLGLTILTNTNTIEIVGETAISQMKFANQTSIDVDMLVISAGIKPRDDLAKLIGLEVGARGGIVVNESLQTSDPCIFAIGECALYKGMIYGLIAPGYEMAEVVANRFMGGNKQFTGFDMSTKLKLIGIDVASFGDPFAPANISKVISYEDTYKGVYKRLNISIDGKKLLGGILVGDADQYNLLLQNCKNNIALPANPEDLIFGSRSGENTVGAGVIGLPDDASICSCEGVSKKEICKAIEGGAETINSIKSCTKAGTGCGGCLPMVKDLLLHTMKTQGKLVRNIICEHFAYSRQELYDLIKIEKHTYFDQVLDGHGKGDGCEICKPVIASILASLWNEMILRNGNDTAQDSNDRFLANIQKGGTYSVVPRIPGGEITPDKLIAIGTIAKQFQLYTKITGGQRIDLFGAHVGDLPAIWKLLIDAGFESGHAYGKALRTVKSCVGSTWCRFGLHDSVSFAIQIEERYRGLRAPHKLKSAVSGCVRECAEAQSKDFGIIATDKGWNLYVCGNGGAKPQHAILLAADLDSETCIKFIDRFLMFYIKTADPLTRTASWLNKMEGGIDYLREVVINDILDINESLEKEMQILVDNYKCEWREVVENSELQKRFKHFINAPKENDPTIAFSSMRNQKKVTDWNKNLTQV